MWMWNKKNGICVALPPPLALRTAWPVARH